MKTNKLKCPDLRIGNNLKYNNKIVKVFGLRPRYIEYYDEDEFLVGDNPEYFEPIELTEELLVKIGFEEKMIVIYCQMNVFSLFITKILSNKSYLHRQNEKENIIIIQTN